MARICKCCICKKKLNTEIAYKVTTNNKNKYYCSENEYLKYLKEEKEKKSCLEVIKEITNTKFIMPIMLKAINELREHYTYKEISQTFIDKKESIRWFLNNKSKDSNEYAKTRYISTIIINGIENTKKRLDKEMEIKLNLFKQTNEVEMDIMNIDTSNIKSRSNDISEFL